MSENEQKAGCVEHVATLQHMREFACFSAAEENAVDAAIAALEAAALSPARSGEAVAWRYRVVTNSGARGKWYFSEDEKRTEGCFEAEPLGVIAPRNESSGVSPGGGDDFAEWWNRSGQYSRAGGGDYERTFAFNAWNAARSLVGAGQAAFTAPAPQDSVRVGDGRQFHLQAHHSNPYELLQMAYPFVRANGVGADYLLVERIEECLRDKPPLTTPAPAAGADGEKVLVPRMPTQAMTDAAEELIPWTRGTESRRAFPTPEQIYDAMLAAALSDGAGQSAGGGL